MTNDPSLDRKREQLRTAEEKLRQQQQKRQKFEGATRDEESRLRKEYQKRTEELSHEFNHALEALRRQQRQNIETIARDSELIRRSINTLTFDIKRGEERAARRSPTRGTAPARASAAKPPIASLRFDRLRIKPK